ncbi:unnamed protein product [Hymenolepis diminuta]|uniref:Uncharacterized protein n=1 Tax=Hymenolepis diminuta TaxID=6216 RepID=A0A564YHP9_HYMDI|nr:unnamed protein product [Hymenolepis diminuta]
MSEAVTIIETALSEDVTARTPTKMTTETASAENLLRADNTRNSRKHLSAYQELTRKSHRLNNVSWAIVHPRQYSLSDCKTRHDVSASPFRHGCKNDILTILIC